MTPWPFSYFPWPVNFLALWIGYSLLLITVYCALIKLIHWWTGYYIADDDDEMEHWRRMDAAVKLADLTMKEREERVKRRIHEN